MAYWVDSLGKLREGDEEQARRYGFKPATDEDLLAHNEALDTAEADTKGPLGLIGEGFERGLSHIQNLSHDTGITPPMPGGDAFGMGGGPMPAFGEPAPVAPAPPAGATTFPESNSEQARLRSKAHPVYEGIGTGLAVAPISALAGAAGAAFGGPAVAGAAIGGIGAEALVEAAAQEYDDAWLEQRPYELKNVAAYTAMFGLGDVLLRGAGKVVSGALERSKSASAIADRNLVAEAQAGSAKAAGRTRPAQSVGAASARDMNEPFDEALATMSDRDATVLARDAEDHYQLVARHAADDLTRIHRGLTESLGSRLKYQDFQIGADAWDEPLIARQSEWLEDLTSEGQAVIEQIQKSPLEFGNAGKQVVADIQRYSDLVMNEADGARRNYLVDQFKKTLDKRVMQVAGDWKSDNVAAEALLDILAPYSGSAEVKGFVREGLENPKLWGHNAELQKAVNAPWHDMLKHWRTFQQKLFEASGEVKFGERGAGRNIQESTAERMLSVLQKDPRTLHDLGQHIGGVFDGYQRLIEARQSKGIVAQEGLEPLADSVRNLMEDWNLATSIGVAKNRAANALKNPRNWGARALDLAEKLPMGVGSTVNAARNVGRMFGDLHIQKGTPLADVWDSGLKRYAQHPSLADASINQNYSDWMQEALRARGAPIPDRRGAQSIAGEVGSRVAGAGLGLGAEAAASSGGVDENGQPQALQAGGLGALAGGLLLGRGGRRLLKEEAAPLIGVLARQEGKDDWTFNRVRQWLKGTSPLSVKHIEHELAPSVQDANGFYKSPEWGSSPRPELRAFVEEAMARTGASEDQVVRELVSAGSGFRPRGPQPKRTPKPKAPVEPAPAVEDRTGIAGEFDDLGEELLTPPDMKEGLAAVRKEWSKYAKADVKAYQSALGFRMNEALRTGNFDRAGADRAGDVQAALQAAIDSGATAPGFVRRGVELTRAEVEALTQAKLLTAKAFVSTSPNPQIAKRFAGAAKRGGQSMRRTTGDVPVLFEIEQATGVPLSAGEVTLRPGTQFKVLGHRIEKGGTKQAPRLLHIFRVRESGYAPGARTEGIIAGGLLGVGGVAAASNARAAEPLELTEPEDIGPAAPPGTLYREAMRGVATGAPLIIQRAASSALRRQVPAGRDAVRSFIGGRRSLDAAVDAARESIRELQGDPMQLIDRLAGTTGDLARTHPSVYMALTEKATQIVGYLAQNVPPRTAQTLLDPEGLPPSRDRSIDFVYKTVGATNPKQAMSDIARLDAPPEEVQSFQANWSELWEGMRLEMLGQIQRRYEAGRPVDGERLRQLDSLLGMNGQLDPSASADVASHILSAASAAPAAPASNSPPTQAPSASGRASGRLQTRLAGMNTESAIG